MVVEASTGFVCGRLDSVVAVATAVDRMVVDVSNDVVG